jgi:hypothetical protein
MAEMGAFIDFVEGRGPRPPGLSQRREARLRWAYTHFGKLYDAMVAEQAAADARHQPKPAEDGEDHQDSGAETDAKDVDPDLLESGESLLRKLYGL